MCRAGLLSLLTVATVVVRHVECTAPARMKAPTFGLIKSTSVTVNFKSVTSAARYHVTVTQKYDSSFTQSFTTTNETTSVIVNLIQSTLYDVTVKAENSQGEIGENSPSSTVQTMPGAPTLKAGNPLPTGVFVFFNTPNSARVSQWRLQYREKGTGDTAMSNDGGYYALWISGLKGDTEYEIRGRALQINENTTLTGSEVDFSAWQTIKTDTLSVFGRVDLVDLTYSSAYSTAHSNEWNSTLAVIQSAYSSVSSVKSINIIRIEDNGGKPVAYYQLRVTDKTLPSATDYTISGSQFSNSIINNGDEAVGTPLIGFQSYIRQYDEYTLVYSPNSSKVCDKLVDRYMLVAPENQDTLEVDLSVFLSDGSTEADMDSLIISGTDASASILNISDITVASSSNESIATISIPAVDKAIKYELLNASNVLNSVPEKDIDGSEYIKVTQQWEQTSQPSLKFAVRVSTRKQDGSTGSVTSGYVTILSDSSDQSITNTTSLITSNSDVDSRTPVDPSEEMVTNSNSQIATTSGVASSTRLHSSEEMVTNANSQISTTSGVASSTRLHYAVCFIVSTISHIIYRAIGFF
uniref:uncharacterized protein LOC120333797 isoform X2 n=1 Tax=Styela clava TaxID=7725 RepID=UPI00193AB82B|nr:uncharacterized protein LOC120333797 isoform X2 [Styela clava]